MKFAGAAAAVAASVLSSSGLVAALPLSVVVSPEQFGVAVLGGQTFTVGQVANENFITQQKGPRALAKVYAKFGASVPDELIQLLLQLLEELGIQIPGLGNGAGAGSGAGSGAGAGKGSGRGSGNRPSNKTSSSNQGMCGGIGRIVADRVI